MCDDRVFVITVRSCALTPICVVVHTRAMTAVSTKKRMKAAITTSTMLLRGTGGVLACVRAESTASGLSYSFLGGTGAARRIVADAIATPAKVTPPAKPSKTVKPQRRPVRGNAQMAASTGAPRALPAACKALVRHLP